MTDKLTDSEIVKALPNMTYGGHYCAKCKYDNGKGNDRCGLKGCKIARYALDLITRQKTENENLKVENQSLRSAANSLKIHYEETQAEIERLRNAYKQCAFERDAYIEIENTAIAEAKAEAYKEFAERLKENPTQYFYETNRDMTISLVSFDRIDNLVKEMVGNDNA